MDTTMAPGDIESTAGNSEVVSRRHALQAWNLGLIVSGIGGFVTGVCGIAIGFAAALGLTIEGPTLYITTTILIGASFVLFGIAAHCIDKANSVERAIRLERCRKHGLKGELYDRNEGLA